MAFFPLLLPIFLAAGYDAVVGVAVILLGAGAGVIASTVNPFATGIAAGFAGSLWERAFWRLIQFVIFEGAAIWYVSAYAARIKRTQAAPWWASAQAGFTQTWAASSLSPGVTPPSSLFLPPPSSP